MTALLEEIIKSRLLTEYVNNTNIHPKKINKPIPWDTHLMGGIPNPMPSTYHSKSKDINNLLEIQAQQDIIMFNTLPNIIKLINSTHTCALTIQHFRKI